MSLLEEEFSEPVTFTISREPLEELWHVIKIFVQTFRESWLMRIAVALFLFSCVMSVIAATRVKRSYYLHKIMSGVERLMYRKKRR